MTLYYTYVTTNLINGKQYIGDHTWEDYQDDHYYGGGTHIKRAIRKYGKQHFEHRILEFFDTKEEAFNAQEKYITEYYTLEPNGYNISPKGGLRVKGCHSTETKRKIGDANKISLKGKKYPIRNSPGSHSRETNQKISESNKGKHNSEEIGKKQKESAKNRTKIKCEYCNREFDSASFGRYHGEKCKQFCG